MGRKSFATCCALGACVVVLAAGSLSAAPPAGGAPPAPENIEQVIRAFFTRVNDAREIDEVLDARAQMLRAYNEFVTGAPDRRAQRERRFAQGFNDVFQDQIKQIAAQTDQRYKLINVAIATSKINGAAIQPSLIYLVNHKNPAARFLGWSGFLNTWPDVLRLGTAGAKPMLDVLENRLPKEDNPLVARMMLKLAAFDAEQVQQTLIPANMLRQAKQSGFQAILAVWPQYLQQVGKGSAAYIELTRLACASMPSLYLYAQAAPGNKEAWCQAIDDLMWALSGEFQELVEAQSTEDKRVRNMCEAALRQAETALLEAMPDVGEPRLNRALDSSELANNLQLLANTLRQGVLDWYDDHDRFGVKPPGN